MPIDSALVEAPEPPQPTAAESTSAPDPPSEATPEKAPEPTTEQPPASDPPADPVPEPSATSEDATVQPVQPVPPETPPAPAEDNAGGETKPEDVKVEPPGQQTVDTPAKESEYVTSSTQAEAVESGPSKDADVQADTPADNGPPPPPSESAPAAPEETTTSPEPEKAPIPPIDTVRGPPEKSGECEQAAQEPPMSPTTKTVHFSPDVKDPDAASIGSKKKGIAKKIGKGKATGYVRIRDPVPVRPASPEEKKKPVKDVKKKEKLSSALKAVKEPVEKEPAPSTLSKKKPSKAEERKKKKHDEKDKKAKGKKTRKGSGSAHNENDAEDHGDEQADGSASEPAATQSSDDPQPAADTQEEPSTEPVAEEQDQSVVTEESVPEASLSDEDSQNAEPEVVEVQEVISESSEAAESTEIKPEGVVDAGPSHVTPSDESQPAADAPTDTSSVISNPEISVPEGVDATVSEPEPTALEEPEILPAKEPESVPTEEPELTVAEETELTSTENIEPTIAEDNEPTPAEEVEPGPFEEPVSSLPEEPQCNSVEEPKSNPCQQLELVPAEAPESSPAEEIDPTPVEEPESGPTDEPDSGPAGDLESDPTELLSIKQSTPVEEPELVSSQEHGPTPLGETESESSASEEVVPEESEITPSEEAESSAVGEPETSLPEQAEPAPADESEPSTASESELGQAQHNAVDSEDSPPEEDPSAEEAVIEDGEDASGEPIMEDEPEPPAQATDQDTKRPDEGQADSVPDTLASESEPPRDTPIENVAEALEEQQDSNAANAEQSDEDKPTEQQHEAGMEDSQTSIEALVTVENEDVDPPATVDVGMQSSNEDGDHKTNDATDAQIAPEDTGTSPTSVDENDAPADSGMSEDPAAASSGADEISGSEIVASPADEIHDVDDEPSESDTLNESGPISDHQQVDVNSAGVNDDQATANDSSSQAAGTPKIEQETVPPETFSTTETLLDHISDDPSNESESIPDREAPAHEELTTTSEPVSNFDSVIDDTPNPVDLAIVERIMKAPSVTSSVQGDDRGPDNPPVITEAGTAELSNEDDPQSASGATDIDCDADTSKEDPTCAPEADKLSAEDEGHPPQINAEDKSSEQDEPPELNNSETAEFKAADECEETVLAEDEVVIDIAPASRSATPPQDTIVEHGSDSLHVGDTDSDDPPEATDISPDTSTTAEVSSSADTETTCQIDESEKDPKSAADEASDDSMRVSSEPVNPDDVLGTQGDQVHDIKDSEDSEGDKDAIALVVDVTELDVLSDESLNAPTDLPADQDDGENGTIPADSGESLSTETENAPIVQEGPVESIADQAEESAAVADVEVPSDAPHNNGVAQQASDDSSATDKSEDAVSKASTDSSIEDVLDEPAGDDAGCSHPESSDNEVEAQPEVSAPAAPEDVNKDREDIDTSSALPDGDSEHLEDPALVNADTTPPEPVPEDLTETLHVDKEDPRSVTSLVDTNTTSDIDASIPSPTPGMPAQISETRGAEPSSQTDVDDVTTTESHTPLLNQDPQAENDPSPMEAPAQDVELPEPEQSKLGEALVPHPEDDVVAEPTSEATVPDLPIQPDGEELTSEKDPTLDATRKTEDATNQEESQDLEKASVTKNAEPMSDTNITSEQDLSSPDANIEPLQSEADAADIETIKANAGESGADELLPSGKNGQGEASTEQEGAGDITDAPEQVEQPPAEQPELQKQESSNAEPIVEDEAQNRVADDVAEVQSTEPVVPNVTTEEPPETTASPSEEEQAEPPVEGPTGDVTPDQHEADPGETDAPASSEVEAPEAIDSVQDVPQNGTEQTSHTPLEEEMDEVQPITPPAEPQEPSAEVPPDGGDVVLEKESVEKPDTEGPALPCASEEKEGAEDSIEKAREPVATPEVAPEPEMKPDPEPQQEAENIVPEVVEETPVERSQDATTEPVTEEPSHTEFVEVDASPDQALEETNNVDAAESSREAVPLAVEEAFDRDGAPNDKQPRTPPNESAVIDEHSPDATPKDKHRRRHSHAYRDSRHSHRRRESNASTSERPTLNPMALLAAAKLAGSAKSKRRDSLTDREYGKHKERPRETENASSSKERPHREHRSHRHHRERGDDRDSKRRTAEEVEAEAERRRRHEARRLEKERIAQEEAAREAAEEDERRQRQREERHARRAEKERLRKEEEARLAREAGEKHAREEEERRIRHEKRRLQHEAEREARRLERKQAEHAEEERRLRRKGKMPTKQAEVDILEPRDAARRAAEEDDEPAPESPVTPRESTRRRTSDRRREPPPPRRNSILGGLFGRSKTDPIVSSSRTIKPVSRVRTDPVEIPSSPVKALRKEDARPSSQHSSNESRDRADRLHRSRRHSHAHRRFNSAEEEAEYRARKEERHRAKELELEMSGARDGGVSLAPHVDDVPNEHAEPQDDAQVQQSPLSNDAAAVLGLASSSSSERRERRRATRRGSVPYQEAQKFERETERPKSRRVELVDRERPGSRRVESDRGPRERERRSTGGRRSTREKEREEGKGVKGFFGGLKRIVA